MQGWNRARTGGSLRALLAGTLAAGLVLGASVGAWAADAVAFEVTVVHVSPTPAASPEKDPRIQRVDRLLRPKLRYESLRILDSQRPRVKLNETQSVDLPTGKKFRFRPLDVGDDGVLVAVDMDQTAQGDFRIPKGKPLFLGGHPYEKGQLLVILEAKD